MRQIKDKLLAKVQEFIDDLKKNPENSLEIYKRISNEITEADIEKSQYVDIIDKIRREFVDFNFMDDNFKI